MKFQLPRYIASKLGYQLVKTRKFPTMDTLLSHLIDRLDIDLVLDIGANRGQFAHRLRKLGYSGEMLSFEPIKNVFKKLSLASTKDDQWHVFHCALGAKTSSTKMSVTAITELASLYPMHTDAQTYYGKGSQISGEEKVNISTVDAVLTERVPNWQKKRIFLKMDTQGYDVEVFNGCKKTLETVAFLSSEISASPMYQTMPNYLDALKVYEDSGFRLTGIYPESRFQNSPLIIDMNAIMVRAH